MRFFMRACRNCLIRPLTCGSPSDCLNSSFISCSDIFCRWYHCRYWKKYAAACLPNTRLNPAPGETLLNFGLSCSPDHTSRCCIMLPPIAASDSIKSGTPRAAISAYSRLCASANRPGPSAWIIQELAIRLRSGIRIPPPIDAENVDRTRVAPAIMNQVLISWLLATSPRSWASSRRFCVGSSVFSDASSSAMVPGLSAERDQVVHDANKIIEKRSHHRRDNEGENEESGKN